MNDDLFNRFVISLVGMVLLIVVGVDMFTQRIPLPLRMVVLAASAVCCFLSRGKGDDDQ